MPCRKAETMDDPPLKSILQRPVANDSHRSMLEVKRENSEQEPDSKDDIAALDDDPQFNELVKDEADTGSVVDSEAPTDIASDVFFRLPSPRADSHGFNELGDEFNSMSAPSDNEPNVQSFPAADPHRLRQDMLNAIGSLFHIVEQHAHRAGIRTAQSRHNDLSLQLANHARDIAKVIEQVQNQGSRVQGLSEHLSHEMNLVKHAVEKRDIGCAAMQSQIDDRFNALYRKLADEMNEVFRDHLRRLEEMMNARLALLEKTISDRTVLVESVDGEPSSKRQRLD